MVASYGVGSIKCCFWGEAPEVTTMTSARQKTDWNAIATRYAEIAFKTRFPERYGWFKHGKRLVIFANMGLDQEKTPLEIDILRKALREAGVKELGFGVDSTSYTWAMAIDSLDGDTWCRKAFDARCETRPWPGSHAKGVTSLLRDGQPANQSGPNHETVGPARGSGRGKSAITLCGGLETTAFWQEVLQRVRRIVQRAWANWTVIVRPLVASDTENLVREDPEEWIVHYDAGKKEVIVAVPIDDDWQESDIKETAFCLFDCVDQYVEAIEHRVRGRRNDKQQDRRRK
jgi:hypothetical protein